MNVLEVKNLSKSFDGKKIIDNISYSVKPGKIVGLLGKNGCGKTTILKLINDLLTIDSGEIKICGENVGEKSKALVSFLPERTYLNLNQTVKNVFDYFQDFYSDFDRNKAEKMLKDLGLDLNMSLNKISKGMKEKIQLILVMSRRAKLYILDEPLGGVDPTTRDYIMDTILKNLNKNSSLIITTHMVADVEKILNEIVFIDNGKIALSGNADDLKAKYNSTIDEIFRRVLK